MGAGHRGAAALGEFGQGRAQALPTWTWTAVLSGPNATSSHHHHGSREWLACRTDPQRAASKRRSARYGFSAGSADEDDVAWARRESHVLRAAAMTAAKLWPSHRASGAFAAKSNRSSVST